MQSSIRVVLLTTLGGVGAAWLGSAGHAGLGPRPSSRRCHAPTLQADPDDLESLFFDRAELFIRSGAGGVGTIGWASQRPAGGSGGAGGSVYLECTESLNTLGHLRGRASIHAGRGADGNDRASGSRGCDSIVPLPPNCLITCAKTNETIGELKRPGERILVARGGQGGQGNGEMWRQSKNNPKATLPPGGTERRHLLLSMTLVADVGLIGHPNAGKSTLLRAVTRAQPKVANYPFTTLVPNLGVCTPSGESSALPMLWLDIPGLIEGAHSGRGLGLAFLRHTERCRLLLHLIDGESETPDRDFLAINRELELYSPQLAQKPQVVILSKADLPAVAERAPAILEKLRAVSAHKRVICISAESGLNLQALAKRTRKLLDQLDEQLLKGG